MPPRKEKSVAATRRLKKIEKPKKSDGIVSLGGNSGGAGLADRKSLGAFDRYGDGSRTIWEKGGEKRIQHR